ncbi:MAG TPA: dienelactone hydrolase family protein [Burkholderiales bacterium]|nr:dienelactone hydrolase family protein [Burkholderiales bacterium]
MQFTRLFAFAFFLLAPHVAPAASPETVRFPSADGRTELLGYLFKPEAAGPHPAIVMLHGRGGPYSSLKRGTYTGETLTMRHRMWGEFWASRGYVALHVDSFGPRGYWDGFPKHSYSQRPPEVSEQFVRPLDAYGALAYLRTRGDVLAERIGLHGWSNGGMTLLSAMATDGVAGDATIRGGFRAALAQYPSCRTQIKQPTYRPYAPLLILAASDDDEVSPYVCRDFAELMRGRGSSVEFVLYEGAHHAYDDPGKTKQSHPPNRAALQDSLSRAEAFFAQHLKP